jgi:mono-ADP-ribosyltransferase sirtuin 6
MSSSGGDYASRLKEFHHKGVCGLPELPDTKRTLERKLATLTALIQNATKIVVLTGAGISTSSGIPDFRGPKGIWTLEETQKSQGKKKGKRKRPGTVAITDSSSDLGSSSSSSSPPAVPALPPTPSMNFGLAHPSLTHRALYYLWKKEVIQFVITQNVDGLHRRSGFPRSALAILHGCLFTEKCEDCGREHFGDDDVGGMSFARTGRHCTCPSASHLRDTMLDWHDPLPEDDWERSQDICDKADLIITLGTSLRMEPAASLTLRGKNYVVVNLQETPYDEDATLVIRGKVDLLMRALLGKLGHADDWMNAYPNPTASRVSEHIGTNKNGWWKTPSEEESE